MHPLLLEHDDGILLQVGHVNQFALGLNFWVLADQQPTHVGEEESPGGVVRIGVCVGELVMHSVVAGPLVDGVLECDGLQDHKEDAEWEARFVGLVRPQSVGTGCYSKGRSNSCDESWRGRGLLINRFKGGNSQLLETFSGIQ